MREIVLDTETTGLGTDDRVIEIGCVELVDLLPTGNNLHLYINPQRDSHPDALRVHGLTTEFLSAYPVFKAQVQPFLDFIQDDGLVIHNAAFDMRMLNAEMARLNKPALTNPVVDTLKISRDRRPGRKHTLDALCGEYKIDRSRRSKNHGALIDSEILAEVYLALRGGRQRGLELPVGGEPSISPPLPLVRVVTNLTTQRRQPLAPRLSAEELAAHQDQIASMPGAIWNKYRNSDKQDAA